MKLDLLGMPVPETEEEFRFWEKVCYVGVTVDDCWEWTGAGSKTRHNSKREGQYGRFEYQGRTQPAHRVAWQMLVGPLTREEHLDHMCEFGLCVNPGHLEPKDLFANVSRSPRQVAMLNRAKTHCAQGHPFDEANTHRDRRGSRHCRTCARERAAATRALAKKKAQ